MTDPGTPEGARRGLVHGLLDGKVDRDVADFVAEAATLRWAGGQAFATALERQAVRAVLIVADRRRELVDTEDQLSRFARFVESNPRSAQRTGGPIDDRGRRQWNWSASCWRARHRGNDHARKALRPSWSELANTIEGYVTVAAAQKNRSWRLCGWPPLASDHGDRLRAAWTMSAAKLPSRGSSIQTSWASGLSWATRCSGVLRRRPVEEARRLFG